MYDNEPIRMIHLEPTSQCNARCPQCPRTLVASPFTDPKLIINEWSSNELEQVLSDPFFKNVEEILINGNYGDIVMHSHPQELINVMLKKQMRINIKTNGGALSVDFWKWLATQKNIEVEFGIDGLEDTHHLYRRNTRFDTVIKNAQAFISAGGTASWMMTVFKHNEHQVKDCKKMAKKLGFATFRNRHSTRWADTTIAIVDKNFDFEYYLEPSSKIKKTLTAGTANKSRYQKILNNTETVELKNFKKVNSNSTLDSSRCFVKNDKSVFLSADKKLWPCCWIAFYVTDSFMKGYNRSSFIDNFFLSKKYDIDFNNVLKYSIDEIIKKGIFKDIEKSWSKNAFKECVLTCDKKSNWNTQLKMNSSKELTVKKMKTFSIIFQNEKSKEFKLKYKVYDTDIATRWFAALSEQCSRDNTVREKDRLYNFPNGEWNEEKLVNELNKCVDIINSSEEMIKHRAFVGMPQEQLNHLHHYFENLRGGVLTPADFWKNSNTEIRSALERFNIIIHRAENFYHNNKQEQLLPRIVCRFNNRPRYDLMENDYQHFTLMKTFGEVYINYCEVGKPLYDVYKDNDDIVGEDNIRPLRYYSADFAVHFHSRSKQNVDDFLTGMSKWWDKNDNYLKALGFKKNDPKNAIGNIPVAKIIPNGLENHEIVDEIAKIGVVDRVEIDEQNRNH